MRGDSWGWIPRLSGTEEGLWKPDGNTGAHRTHIPWVQRHCLLSVMSSQEPKSHQGGAPKEHTPSLGRGRCLWAHPGRLTSRLGSWPWLWLQTWRDLLWEGVQKGSFP